MLLLHASHVRLFFKHHMDISPVICKSAFDERRHNYDEHQFLIIRASLQGVY